MDYRKHISGAREVFNVEKYKERFPNADIATCGRCLRHWDDAFISGVTPTPAGRCPFEYQH